MFVPGCRHGVEADDYDIRFNEMQDKALVGGSGVPRHYRFHALQARERLGIEKDEHDLLVFAVGHSERRLGEARQWGPRTSA